MANTPSFVTLNQAKDHLRQYESYDDADIQLKIEQATAIILDFLKLSGVPDSWNSDSASESPGGGVPPLIQAATLLVLGELFKNREASAADLLSPGIKDLLRRYRDPALA